MVTSVYLPPIPFEPLPSDPLFDVFGRRLMPFEVAELKERMRREAADQRAWADTEFATFDPS